MKTQIIRLADVFLIGPTMVYGGHKLRQDSKVLGWALIAFGVATVLYNGRNYVARRRLQQNLLAAGGWGSAA